MRLTRMMAATLMTALAIAGEPRAATKTNLADLASVLQDQRDICAKLAADAKRTYSLAQYQSGLDRQTAALKAEMDARVYGVGHGRRETTAFYLDKMQQATSAQDAKDKEVSDAFAADTKSVAQCVSDIEQKGKASYVAFKQKHADKLMRSQAESLMTAWLANVGEISADSPDGGDATFGAWKEAKARAEVSSL
jgi:hypothetical protein